MYRNLRYFVSATEKIATDPALVAVTNAADRYSTTRVQALLCHPHLPSEFFRLIKAALHTSSQLRFIMFKPVLQAVQMFLKGASGKDRQDKHHLSEHLLALQVAYDQLQKKQDALQTQNSRLQRECDRLQHSQQELTTSLQRHQLDLDELINVADTDAKDLAQENEDLQSRLRHSEDSKDALKATNATLLGKIAVLENQLTLRSYQSTNTDTDTAASNHKTENRADSEKSILNLLADDISFEQVDLSDVSLALIGGHETTYRTVTAELKQYGLKNCVHVPPHSIASNSRHQIKDKISNCDLIITVTSYVDHSVSKCVKQLNDAKMLAGECIRVSCHGKSGLVREVLQYFADPLQPSGMV